MAIQPWEVVVAKQELAREPYNDYLNRLLDMGIEKIGKGASATVFQHPKYRNVVVKIAVAKSDSDAYEWLKWCKSVKNRYVPKVFYLSDLNVALPKKWRGKVPPRVFICFMEKLAEADLVTASAFFKEHNYVFARLEPKFWGIDSDNFHLVDDKELLAVLQAIDRIGFSDLKLENIMMRGKQIVFADPVY